MQRALSSPEDGGGTFSNRASSVAIGMISIRSRATPIDSSPCAPRLLTVLTRRARLAKYREAHENTFSARPRRGRAKYPLWSCKRKAEDASVADRADSAT